MNTIQCAELAGKGENTYLLSRVENNSWDEPSASANLDLLPVVRLRGDCVSEGQQSPCDKRYEDLELRHRKNDAE